MSASAQSNCFLSRSEEGLADVAGEGV